MVIDIEEIKTIIEIKDSKHDVYLATMIPLVLEHVTDFCNNSFPDGIPGGVRIFIAKVCEHNIQNAGLKSRTMGSVSYSYELEFPSSLMRFIRPYRRLKFHASR